MALSFLFRPPKPVRFVTPDGDLEGALVVAPKLFGSGEAVDAGIITLDASIEESHSFGADVTRFPTEEGVEITDHVTLKPRSLRITGHITDSPVQYLSALTAGGAGGITTWGGSLSRSAKAYDALRWLWYNREPFDVITGLDLYRNMILTGLEIPRDAQIGQRLRFSATMDQIRIVTTDPAVSAAAEVGEILSDLGAVAASAPDATTILAAAVFVGAITYKLATGGAPVDLSLF